MPLLHRLLAFSTLLVLFSACRKPAGTDWDVDAVFPVVTSSLTISNFADDSVFRSDNTGLLHLSIRREVGTVKLDSLVEFDQTSSVTSFTSNSQIPLTLTAGSQIPNLKVQNLKFKLDSGMSLTRISIRTASFKVRFSNDLTEPLDLVYKINGATKNGVAFQIAETVPPGQYSLEREYSLEGYDLNLRGATGAEFNTLAQTYTVTVNANANNVTVPFGKGAHAEVLFTKIIPQVAEGYFGQRTIKIPADTARIDLLENLSAKNLLLSDAKMDFRILNEFGAEFRANLGSVTGINYSNNQSVMLQTTQLANLNINRATRSGGSAVPSVKEVSFNSGNSNIIPFISNLPQAITYSGSVKLNPLKNISGYNDFAFYNTGLRVMADLDIPLQFRADELTLQSNNEISFSSASALDGVNYGQLVVNITNGFPFTAVMQAYLYDADLKLIDSLFVPGTNVVNRGTLDANNEVTQPSVSKMIIPVNQEKLSNLKRAKTIRIRSRFLLPGSPPDTRVLDHYSMAVKIVAEVNYNVRLK